MNAQAQHVLKSALALPESDRAELAVLKSALALPESDRAELAASLIQSLDPQGDEDTEAAWSAEIKRRVESIDRGEVELAPWEDVMREIRD